jgi:hypothetical protein
MIATRIVVYSSSNDKAVGIADFLFKSRTRLGTLSQETVKPAGQKSAGGNSFHSTHSL